MDNSKFTVAIDHEFFKNIKVDHQFLKNDVSALIDFLFTNREWISITCIIDVIEEFLKNLNEEKDIQKDILDLLKNFRMTVKDSAWYKNDLIRILWIIDHIKDSEYIKLFLHYVNYKKITDNEIDKIFKDYIKEYYQMLEKYDFPLIKKDSKHGERILNIIHCKDIDMEAIKSLLLLNFKSIESCITSYKFLLFEGKQH